MTFNKESVDEIIKAAQEVLETKRLTQKELYEHLIAKGVISPNSEVEFRKFYEWASSNCYIDTGRIRKFHKKKGKLPRYFSKPQLEKLFNCIDRPKDGIACFLGLMCALRISEVCNLQIKDVNLEDHSIFVRNSKNPNRKIQGYGKDRIVRFDRAIAGPIKRWINIIQDTSPWLLPSDHSPDKPLRPKSVHERFRSYLKQANLAEVDYTVNVSQKVCGKTIERTVRKHKYYFHCLRHTMASIIYNKTSDIYAVKEFLGHERVDTTTIYAKMTETKMRGVVASVFSSLHYNYYDGNHIPLPQQTAVKSQPVVQTNAGSPLELLEVQFVNGDISESEFLRKKQVLGAMTLSKTIEIRD